MGFHFKTGRSEPVQVSRYGTFRQINSLPASGAEKMMMMILRIRTFVTDIVRLRIREPDLLDFTRAEESSHDPVNRSETYPLHFLPGQGMNFRNSKRPFRFLEYFLNAGLLPGIPHFGFHHQYCLLNSA